MFTPDGIAFTHPQLQEVINLVELTEDVVEGDVRSEEYVPRFTGQSDKAYEKFLNRAAFFNLTERTLSAVIGALIRKPYTLEGDGFNIDGAYSLEDGLIGAFADNLITGRVGWLLDPTPEDPRRVVQYCSDDILNWGDGFVVLDACQMVQSAEDPLIQEEQDRRLVLWLDNGVYTSQYWVKGKGKNDKYQPVGEPIVPQFRGKALNFIPFICFSPSGIGFEPTKPPLHTMACLNLQHFNTSLLIAHGSRFFALPKPWVSGVLSGVDTSGNPPSQVTVGTEDVLLLNPGASVGYLEFSGAGGMTFLADERTKLEDQMLLLGSRLLTEKTGVESVEALNLRLSTETASLMSLIKVTEAAMNTMLTWCQLVDGRLGSIVLNKDLALASAGTNADIPTVIDLLKNGVITRQGVLEESQRRGLLAPTTQLSTEPTPVQP